MPPAQSISKQVTHSQPCGCLSEHTCRSQKKVTEGWTKAQLWHRSCPWGGHLIKFDTWPHHFWDTTCGQSDVLDATPRCVKSWASHAKKQMCEYHVKLRTNQVPCKWLYAWPLECAADLIFESAFKGLSARIMFRTQFSLFDHTCHPRTSKAFKSRMPQKRPATWS